MTDQKNSEPLESENLPEEEKAAEQTETTQEGEQPSPLEKLQQEKDELEDRLTRTQAELVNYRRRTQNENAQFRKYEGLNLVRDLLPVIDNLQRAVGASEQANSVDDVKKGVEMVIQQFLDILASREVKRIPTEGEAFDPNLHDAVQQVPSQEIPAMHIAQELETGYQMADRVVRPAKVIVSTGPQNDPAEQQQETETEGEQ